MKILQSGDTGHGFRRPTTKQKVHDSYQYRVQKTGIIIHGFQIIFEQYLLNKLKCDS